MHFARSMTKLKRLAYWVKNYYAIFRRRWRILLCLVHIADTDDKTRQHCLDRVGAVNWIGDKSRQFSVVFNIFETEQLQIGNWVETRLNSVHTAFWNRAKLQKKTKHVQFRNFLSPTVLTGLQFSSHRRHQQDSLVSSVSVVWTRL